MVLDIRTLLSGEKDRIDESYSLSLTDSEGGSLLGEDVRFEDDARVRLSLTNDAGYMALRVKVECSYVALCSRCLDEVRGDFSFDFERTVTTEGVLENIGEDDADDYVIVEGGMLDIDAQLKEELELVFPYKLLCSDDCKGLCSTCGKNLNRGKCDCKESVGDPRFQILAQLLENKD